MNHRPPLRPIALLLLSLVLRGGVAAALGADEPPSTPAPLPIADTTELGAAGAMRGTDSRSHCSAASRAIAASRSGFTRSATARRVSTGWISPMPSSVAFSMLQAMASRFSTASSSRVSARGPGGRRCSGAPAPGAPGR